MNRIEVSNKIYTFLKEQISNLISKDDYDRFLETVNNYTHDYHLHSFYEMFYDDINQERLQLNIIEMRNYLNIDIEGEGVIDQFLINLSFKISHSKHYNDEESLNKSFIFLLNEFATNKR